MQLVTEISSTLHLVLTAEFGHCSQMWFSISGLLMKRVCVEEFSTAIAELLLGLIISIFEVGKNVCMGS